MDAREITEALGGRWRGRQGLACCPAHQDSSPSLSIGMGKDGRVLVHCHAGCKADAVITELRRMQLWPGHAEEMTEAEREECHQRDADREAEERRYQDYIDALWRKTWRDASPAHTSAIENWLRVRGIDAVRLDLDRLPLRWAPRCPLGKTDAPAMIALMTDAVTGEACGLHRTFLLGDGSGKALGSKSRKMLGKAGIIRLSPDDEVELGLGICEGIETGLSLLAAGWGPIWTCGSLVGVRSFPTLSGIEAITIFSDPKAHEIEAARGCARRWASAWREAAVRIPGPGGDWNDVLGRAA